MAAEDEPAFEAQQQVLAHRFDCFQPAAVEPFRDPLCSRAWMRRLDLDTLADERLQLSCGAAQGVTFGHRAGG